MPGPDNLATECGGRASSLDDVVPGNSRCHLDGGVLYDTVAATCDLSNVGNEKSLVDASHNPAPLLDRRPFSGFAPL
jgi:hypothetical protein